MGYPEPDVAAGAGTAGLNISILLCYGGGGLLIFCVIKQHEDCISNIASGPGNPGIMNTTNSPAQHNSIIYKKWG